MRLGNVLVIAKYMVLATRGWHITLAWFMVPYPLLWLWLLKLVGYPTYVEHFVVGTVLSTAFQMPYVVTAQDVASMKHWSRQYSLLLANGADHLEIALSYLAQSTATTAGASVLLLAASAAVAGVAYGPAQVAAAAGASALISAASCLLGYAQAIGIRNPALSQQMAQIVPLLLILVAPVYYPADLLPEPLRAASHLLPTTYMAYALRGALALNPEEAARGAAGILAYAAASALVTIYAVRREQRHG
ncbi:ABC transporter permease [Pyrobaculum neutrophilum]|uniref:ABC-2 type transporter n=1 Tax=Pyrobaculum neutrophilum (strain DSM 2338 / JCM 9278 / NBRC 100436 / V24Sta) TaxID=444157 RepID=B1YE18_PYRNV|nr:ABC transporter permease [Pyrobaculum neutrophilum]ACB40031.1 ABC-2 type transporter [Pyrobaculum neutrophilum V24Sta]